MAQANGDVRPLQEFLINNLSILNDKLGSSGFNTTAEQIGNRTTGKPDDLMGKGTGNALHTLILISQLYSGVKPEDVTTELNAQTRANLETMLADIGIDSGSVSKFLDDSKVISDGGRLATDYQAAADVDVSSLKAPDLSVAAEIEQEETAPAATEDDLAEEIATAEETGPAVTTASVNYVPFSDDLEGLPSNGPAAQRPFNSPNKLASEFQVAQGETGEASREVKAEVAHVVGANPDDIRIVPYDYFEDIKDDKFLGNNDRLIAELFPAAYDQAFQETPGAVEAQTRFAQAQARMEAYEQQWHELKDEYLSISQQMAELKDNVASGTALTYTGRDSNGQPEENTGYTMNEIKQAREKDGFFARFDSDKTYSFREARNAFDKALDEAGYADLEERAAEIAKKIGYTGNDDPHDYSATHASLYRELANEYRQADFALRQIERDVKQQGIPVIMSEENMNSMLARVQQERTQPKTEDEQKLANQKQTEEELLIAQNTQVEGQQSPASDNGFSFKIR